MTIIPWPIDEDEEPDETVQCAVCGGPCDELGSLGNLTHYRCRNCGMMNSVAAAWYQDKKIEPAEDETAGP